MISSKHLCGKNPPAVYATTPNDATVQLTSCWLDKAGWQGETLTGFHQLRVEDASEEILNKTGQIGTNWLVDKVKL